MVAPLSGGAAACRTGSSLRCRSAWGRRTTHRLCTNEYGFKSPCAQHGPAPKSYDIAFIGDSYTEGVGLPYEDTFVGRIAAQLPDKSIVNLDVVSDAPSIYLAKIRYLLDQGFRFKQAMVYGDISDIQDEAAFYRYDAETGAVLDMDPNDPDGSLAVPRLKRWIKGVFPLTYKACWWTAELSVANRFDYPTRSLRTIDIDAKGYGAMGAAASVDKSVRLMTELHELLRQHGIGMSVGIYPWPRKLRHDHVDSRQVQVWQAFWQQRCEYFFNSFPSCFQVAQHMGTEPAIEALFIRGDSHHLPAGAELIASNFLAQYRRH